MLHSGTSTLGGILIGTVVSSILFGVNTVQTALYFSWFSSDPGPRVAHVLVAVAWTLQGLEVVFLGFTAYTSALGNLSSNVVTYNPWSGVVWILIGVVMSGLVQAFYAWRIHQLNRNIYLMLTLAVLIVFKLGVGTAVAILPSVLGFSTWTIKQTVWVPPVWMATDGVIDLTLVVFMFFTLFTQRTGFSSTDRIINRMLRYCVHTGLLTSTVCIASVITYWLTGTGVATISLNIIAFSLYVTAMLANLHTRSGLRRLFKRGNSLGVSVPLDILQSSIARSSSTSATRIS